MLTKNGFFFFFTYFFFMLPNTGKHGKLSLHKVFHQNKQSIRRKPLQVFPNPRKNSLNRIEVHNL